MRKTLIIISLSFLVSACGFKLRSSLDWPQALRQVHYAPENPYSSLAVRLKSLLTTMGVTFVNSSKQSRYTLLIENDHFTSSRAEVVNANLPSSVTYTQTATIVIKDNHSQTKVAAQQFSATQSITLNANQIYVPNTSGMIKQTLNQEIQTRIYYWLTSENIKHRLTHATPSKSTPYAS